MKLTMTVEELPTRTRYQSKPTLMSHDDAFRAVGQFEQANGLTFNEVLFVPVPRGGHVVMAYVDKD